MQKLLLATVAVITVAGAHCAMAADMPLKAPPPAPPAIYDWTGFYTGLNVGAAWGSYDPRTSTVPDGVINASTPSVNAAGIQSINPVGFTGGSQAGYNWQWGNWVTGIEGDFNYLHLNGEATSGAVPLTGHAQAVVSSYGDADWLFTLRPRIGWTISNWLFYATGGLAVTDVNDDFALTTEIHYTYNAASLLQSGRIDNDIQAGYAVGGGIETGITDRLSVKAEYLHVNFDRAFASTTTIDHPAQLVTQSADLRADMVRVGFNYRLGGADTPAYAYAGSPTANAPIWPWPAINKSNWEFDAGTRTWLSSGTIGAPNPFLTSREALTSRLVFHDLDAVSGETYARVDHSSGLFVKGFLGAGGIFNGYEHDEDFNQHAYSTELESGAAGNLGYANIDLGYTFLRSPGAKLGAFVGYNYYTEHVNVYGCTEIAGSQACAPPPGNSMPNFLRTAQDDHFNSLRVGLSSETMLTDRLKFTADAAYVPWTDFGGLDDHNQRQLLFPEAASTGDGVMLEAVLSYDITKNWNVGVGGRYWAWNMRNGTITSDYVGLAAGTPVPAGYTSERYGVFAQMGYHWGDTTPAASAGTPMPVKALAVAAAPMNWSGFYIGGHLGGGWSDDQWSDPFGSTPGPHGTTNVAGFGDTTHATGPLGGGQIGANWQTGHWVLGLQADADAADLRGENTCFSGMGGINCQRIVNALGTVTGRVGFAWDRSLIYAKGGGAWADATYNLNGFTVDLPHGTTGSANLYEGGWTVGAGLEYALTNHWTTLFEYDHIGIGSVTVPFPTVAVINTQNIGIKQSIDLFKLGVNYKFDWGALVLTSN